MDWKEQSKKHFMSECVILFAIFVCCITSVISELCAANNIILLEILNFDAISLVIIQIQATVQTLSIALLALASGYAADSHMGIHYNRYLFQIKPRIFRQRTVVITLIALLVVNVFFHMLGWYNIVTGIFAVACIFVAVSAWEIYGIFVGYTQIREEIEAYTAYLSSNDRPLNDRISALHTFCGGWKDCMESQSNREFDRHMTVYRVFLKSLLMEQPAQARECLQEEAVSLIAAFGRSMNQNVRERGLVFLFACYEDICGAVRGKNLLCEGGIHIFRKASYDVIKLIRSLSVRSIEQNFTWYNFIEYVLVANLNFGNPDDNEFSDIVDLSSLMGFYITEHKADDYNDSFWGHLLENAEECLSVPAAYTQRMQELFETVKYKYAVRLIQGGMLNLLKDHLYQNAMRNANQIKSISGGRLILKVHCYLYYLSEYESTDCVLPELKKDCAVFLQDTEVQRLYSYALRQIGYLDDKHTRRFCAEGYLFTAELVDQIYHTLMRDELYPRFGRGKTMMMSAVVMDFITFCGLHIHGLLYSSTILERMIPDEKATSYYYRFICNNDSKPRLTRFFQLLGKDNCENTSAMLLRAVEKLLKEKIKRSQIINAEQMQKSYEADNGRPIALQNACRRILEHLNQTFSDFLFNGTDEEAYVKFHVYSLNVKTDTDIEEEVEKNLNLWSRMLIEGLCDVLKRLGAIRVRNRSDYPDDQQLIAYLENKAFAEVIGSEWVFRTKEYSNRESIMDNLKSKVCVLEEFSHSALLLKKAGVRFCIQNVRIGVHPAEIRDRSVTKKGSIYHYSPIDGIELDFSKEELKKLLHDSRKVYDILYEVSIRRDAGIIGDVFYSD